MRILLRPFSWLYGIGTALRNFCFDRGLLPSESFKIPIISVGNLVAGGSGKSPHVLLLAKWLKPHYRVAILSRGYGRKTKGFHLVKQGDGSAVSGDEPLQYVHYDPDLLVAVCEDRREGIRRLLQHTPSPQVILLDDAYQHRYVKAGLNLLVTEFDHPFTNDHLLPEGMLREAKKGAERADYIVVSKSPETATKQECDRLRNLIRKYSKAPVYFTYMRYREPVSFSEPSRNITLDKSMAVLLVTGIARPEPLVAYLQGKVANVQHQRFRDHYEFTATDLIRIRDAFNHFKNANTEAILCTTRKDSMRLTGRTDSALEELPFYIIDIEPAFTDGEDDFRNAVLTYVQSNS